MTHRPSDFHLWFLNCVSLPEATCMLVFCVTRVCKERHGVSKDRSRAASHTRKVGWPRSPRQPAQRRTGLRRVLRNMLAQCVLSPAAGRATASCPSRGPARHGVLPINHQVLPVWGKPGLGPLRQLVVTGQIPGVPRGPSTIWGPESPSLSPSLSPAVLRGSCIASALAHTASSPVFCPRKATWVP